MLSEVGVVETQAAGWVISLLRMIQTQRIVSTMPPKAIQSAPVAPKVSVKVVSGSPER